MEKYSTVSKYKNIKKTKYIQWMHLCIYNNKPTLYISVSLLNHLQGDVSSDIMYFQKITSNFVFS